MCICYFYHLDHLELKRQDAFEKIFKKSDLDPKKKPVQVRNTVLRIAQGPCSNAGSL